MAEKMETILSRGVFNTRPRDYYDIYILGSTQEFDRDIFRMALNATAQHRGSLEKIKDIGEILKQISESPELRDMWGKYQSKFAYAKDISYESVMEEVRKIAGFL